MTQPLRAQTAGQALRSLVKKAGVLIGTRTYLNFIEGSNVTLTISDDSANDKIDITIAASGGSGAPTDADYLVGTANAGLSAEIAVGTSPGGDLAGVSSTWAAPVLKQASSVFAFTGFISPTQISANTDDYAPTGLSGASVLRLSTDASRNLTGITGGAAGRVLKLVNVGAQNIVLKHDVTSTAANRFYCPGDTDYTLVADGAVDVIYDSTSSRWRVVLPTRPSISAGASIGTAITGTGTSWARNDHVHPTGAGTPTNSAVGDAAAVGAGPAAAMTNHVHGREAYGLVSVTVVASDVPHSTNDATLINATGLTFTPVASTKYWIDAFLVFNATTATADGKVAWTGPASFTDLYWGFIGDSTSGPNGWSRIGTGGTPGAISVALATATGFGSFNGTWGMSFGMYINVASDVTALQLQFAKNTAEASTLTLKAGSHMKVWKLA